LETGRVKKLTLPLQPDMLLKKRVPMKKFTLIVEKQEQGLTGRVLYDDDLIVESGKDLRSLEDKMGRLLKKFHGVDPEEVHFQYKYDISSLFETFDVLKISNVAKIAGLNPSLLRQYVIGNKQASATQARKIEAVIHKLGKDLAAVQIYGQ
jgi:hypothetical protein